MDDDILNQILWLLNKFGVEADVSLSVITTTPLCFHPL